MKMIFNIGGVEVRTCVPKFNSFLSTRTKILRDMFWNGVGLSSSYKIRSCQLYFKTYQHKSRSVNVSVKFSLSVVSVPLRPHEPQHIRPSCPSPAPGVHPNPCPLSRWCHPTISSSVIPFSCPQSFRASGSFQMSQLFASGGQSTGVWASTSVLPMNTQDWSMLGWTGWISLESKGLSRVFSNTTVQKHQFFSAQLSLHPYMFYYWKTIALTRWTFANKVMSLFLICCLGWYNVVWNILVCSLFLKLWVPLTMIIFT